MLWLNLRQTKNHENPINNIDVNDVTMNARSFWSEIAASAKVNRGRKPKDKITTENTIRILKW